MFLLGIKLYKALNMEFFEDWEESWPLVSAEAGSVSQNEFTWKILDGSSNSFTAVAGSVISRVLSNGRGENNVRKD